MLQIKKMAPKSAKKSKFLDKFPGASLLSSSNGKGQKKTGSPASPVKDTKVKKVVNKIHKNSKSGYTEIQNPKSSRGGKEKEVQMVRRSSRRTSLE